jgi:hypothetical protein
MIISFVQNYYDDLHITLINGCTVYNIFFLIRRTERYARSPKQSFEMKAVSFILSVYHSGHISYKFRTKEDSSG